MTTLAPTASKSAARITIPPPHSPAQRELIEYPGNIVLLGGGRFGKTEAAVRRIIRAMVREPDLYMWIGLSWKSASMRKAWRMIVGHWTKAFQAAGLDPAKYINRGEYEIRTPAGSLLMFRTAESPESIAGDGPRGVVGDEFTYWNEEVFRRFLQPAMLDKQATGSWVFLLGRPAGENWAIDLWRKAAGWDGWIARHYTIWDNPTIPKSAIERLQREMTPADFDQEMLAKLGTGDTGVIPLAWVELAIKRWEDWDATGRPSDDPRLIGVRALGVDVSEGAVDRVQLAPRRGWCIGELIDATPPVRGDRKPIVRACIQQLTILGEGAVAVVDSIGVGAFIPGELEDEGYEVQRFRAGDGTKLRDASGEFGFVDMRAAAWWHGRECLNPENGMDIMLPPDRALVAELTAPRYRKVPGSRIRVESKDDIRKRIGRSTDKADSVLQSLFCEGASGPIGALPWATPKAEPSSSDAARAAQAPTRRSSSMGARPWDRR